MDNIENHSGILVNERVSVAETAVRAYLMAKGEKHTTPIGAGDISDLMADLGHLADALKFSHDEINESAKMHYNDEKEDI